MDHYFENRNEATGNEKIKWSLIMSKFIHRFLIVF